MKFHTFRLPRGSDARSTTCDALANPATLRCFTQSNNGGNDGVDKRAALLFG